MSQRKEIVNSVIAVKKELARIEKKNEGPLNINTDKQLQLIMTELGRLSENMLKAHASARNNDGHYANYYVGIRNQVKKLAARAIGLIDYLDRHFEADGTPIKKDKKN